MCGRYGNFMPAEEITALFGAEGPLVWDERFNIAPSQDAPIALRSKSGNRVGTLRWGLHVGSADRGRRQINARSETIHTRPAFRTAFERRRCVVPASGFFEWRLEGDRKVPYWITAADGAPLVMAGVWGRDPESSEQGGEQRMGEPGFAVLTRAATEPLLQIHERMPAILNRAQWDAWLDRDASQESLLGVLTGPPTVLTAHPVSTAVNRPVNDDPGCITPSGPPLF